MIDPGDEQNAIGDIRLAMRAIREGWEVPGQTMRDCIKNAADALNSPKPSVRMWAAEFLRKCSETSMTAAEKIDKMERLDAGKPTDGPQKVEVVFIDKPHAH